MIAYFHQDTWDDLNLEICNAGKLDHVRKVMLDKMPFVDRISVALYDTETDYLRTYAYSSEQDSPLNHYQAKLAKCKSLLEIKQTRKSRVVQNLALFKNSEHKHTKAIYKSGFQSSYTFPMFWRGELFGFIFFNSTQAEAFGEELLPSLDTISHLIAFFVHNEIHEVKTLSATVKSALQLTHIRDPETGAHLERMSHYSRLIASKIAPKYGFSDYFIEYIGLFAPLHDLGKLAIPDSVLLKQGSLNEEEFSTMKQHSVMGKKLVDHLIENFQLQGLEHIEVLRNLVLSHHEMMDGSGYPEGLSGDEIPIEARIITVADIFDALTSKRPYKEAWSIDEAFAEMEELAKSKLDPDCVAALINNREQVEEIKNTFLDEG
ncbi:MAG: HD domain-containing protein [Gammaproteobacteria bacterium]|nr:HD domain-containing protein [Gammaproteobacteria bacterium]MDH5629597.1 HD domain-containing protein [Gammaproteobacteria bacterium]